MSTPSFIITSESIHLNMDGTHFTIGRQNKKFGQIYELLKENKFDEIKELLLEKPKVVVEFVDGSGLTLVGDNLVDSEGNTLPHVLTARMHQMKRDGFSLEALVKFWNNLKENPSLRSREQLFKFLEFNGHPITEDGCFIAYRGVTKDFKDKHTRTFDNSPGAICEMPRRDVDDDPNNTCSRGLHVAAWEYAKNWSSTTVEVKVNPKDVVAVPTDYNGQKMRVCKFEVVRECHQMVDDSFAYECETDSSWDGWDFDDAEDEGYDPDDVNLVIEFAKEFKGRFVERTSLAARIEDEHNMFNIFDSELSLSDILVILNENEDSWVDA